MIMGESLKAHEDFHNESAAERQAAVGSIRPLRYVVIISKTERHSATMFIAAQIKPVWW